MILPSMKYISTETRSNIVDSIFYTATMVFSVSFGEFASRNAEWKQDYEQCFKGFPHELDPYLKAYYTFCLGFYIFWMYCVIFVDERKKDHVAMVLHHVVTMVVILLSALGGTQRIGVVIMLSFDVCDILLESAKICNRSKLHNSAATFFVFFVIFWTKNRVINYPQMVWVAWIGEDLAGSRIAFHTSSVNLLVIILLLQYYWSYFIVKKIGQMWSKGITAGEDPRDESMKEYSKEKKKLQ
jgi:hypothetical protein